jgi:hopanoid biosynthesis associated protein HpnK
MKYLIVNADDFGLDANINQGIIQAYTGGIVTSTSILANGDSFFTGMASLREHPGLGVGVHLTLVNGRPLSPPAAIPSLLNEDGEFLADYQEFIARFLIDGIKLSEVRSEWSRQILQVQNQGIKITHIDSHQHLHVLPGIHSLVTDLAKEFHITKVRVPGENMLFFGGNLSSVNRLLARDVLTGVSFLSKLYFDKKSLAAPEHFYGMLWGGQLNENRLKNIITQLPLGSSEIMTHPGLNNRALEHKFAWGYQWEEELAALTSLNIKNLIQQQEIRLINYRDLPG